VLGHGLAVQAIRAQGRPGTKVGPAEQIISTAPIIETPENIRAAASALREFNAGYMTVMAEGKYTDAFLAKHGVDAPTFTAEDLKIIGSPIDFMGINIYVVHAFVQATDAAPRYEIVAGDNLAPKPFRPFPPTHPRAVYPGSNGTVVFPFGPESMYWGTRLLRDVWGAKEIFVTESGLPTTAEGDADRPRRVAARLRCPAAARDSRGCAGARLVPLEHDGQLRMDHGLPAQVRSVFEPR
jgi:beta-glucosidase